MERVSISKKRGHSPAAAPCNAHFSWDQLENINGIFARMADGRIDGRIVVNLE